MSRIFKDGASHILISLFVAPITLSVFAWAGSEFLSNRDVRVSMPDLESKIDKVIEKQDICSKKREEVLKLIYSNMSDLKSANIRITHLEKAIR